MSGKHLDYTMIYMQLKEMKNNDVLNMNTCKPSLAETQKKRMSLKMSIIWPLWGKCNTSVTSVEGIHFKHMCLKMSVVAIKTR